MDEKETQLKTYVLDRTKPDQKEAMTQLIEEVLDKRHQDQLSTLYLMGIVPKAMGMIQPEAMADIKAKLNEFR